MQAQLRTLRDEKARAIDAFRVAQARLGAAINDAAAVTDDDFADD